MFVSVSVSIIGALRRSKGWSLERQAIDRGGSLRQGFKSSIGGVPDNPPAVYWFN